MTLFSDRKKLPVLHRDGRDIVLRRAYNGLSWPAEFPGCVVAVGEEAELDVRGIRRMHVLEIAEASNKDLLLQAAVEFQIQFQAEPTFGRKEDSHRDYLYYWDTKVRQEGLPRLSYYIVRNSENALIEYHIDLIRSLTRAPDPVLLGLVKFQGLLSQLQAVPQVYHETKENQFPAVAALGYALAGMNSIRVSDESQVALAIQRQQQRNRSRNRTTGY